MISNRWQTVPLGELLTPVARPESVIATKSYNILGAHWYAQGLYTKETKLGSEIQARLVYRVNRGDFVYNRLFAWKGAFALASGGNHGCYVSNEFPCFEVNQHRLNSKYLAYYFSRQSVWNEALGLSSGGTPTSRNRLKEARLLAMTIPLPSVDEQGRVVARIEEVATQVNDARALRREAEKEVVALPAAYSLAQFESSGHWEQLRIVDACEDIIDYRGRTPPISDVGVPHITSANIKNGRINWHTTKFVTEETYAAFMSRGIPRAQDVLFTMEAPLGEVGVVPDSRKFSLAQRVILLRPKASILLGDFLAKAFSSPGVREKIHPKATATTVSGIASKRLKEIQIPIPPLPEQRRLVADLDALQAEVDILKHLQAETTIELDALLPSVLSKAFAGEL